MGKLDELMKKCGMSAEMVKHIISYYDHPEKLFCDIVCGAPVSLSEKLDIISDYLDLYPGEEEVSNAYIQIVAALNELRDEESFNNGTSMLYLFDEWYDTDVFIKKSCSDGMYCSLDDALSYIEKEDSYELEDYADENEIEEEWYNSWYRIELWKRNSEGHMEYKYEYYIFDGIICWFNKLEAELEDYGNIWYSRGEDRLYSESIFTLDHISTPYSTGDIVKIDCRPFGPKFYALILEDRDQFDSCFPTMLFKVPYTDQWRCRGLKHGMFYKDAETSFYYPQLSPVYRLEKVYTENLDSDEYKHILELRDLLGEDSDVAEEAWKNFDDEMSFERVVEVIQKAKG